jgi:hypothetical protein
MDALELAVIQLLPAILLYGLFLAHQAYKVIKRREEILDEKVKESERSLRMLKFNGFKK